MTFHWPLTNSRVFTLEADHVGYSLLKTHTLWSLHQQLYLHLPCSEYAALENTGLGAAWQHVVNFCCRIQDSVASNFQMESQVNSGSTGMSAFRYSPLNQNSWHQLSVIRFKVEISQEFVTMRVIFLILTRFTILQSASLAIVMVGKIYHRCLIGKIGSTL